ncbi:MAG: arginine--tRNA ligase [archaeon]|nr:arginine--tRNA ligase [archaeon]MCR4323722.1 arginine--tRNA ligase [Nanoarchaeota archaeon]
MKKEIAKLVSKEYNLPTKEVESLIEIPPNDELGDYAFPCFSLAKKLKKSPIEIAEDLTNKLRKNPLEGISNISQAGSYVNFLIDKKILAESVLKEVGKKSWGTLNLENKKIGIEYPGPNTNKALHVGHLRNISIGESLSNISKAIGNKIFHVNIYNDRGILISKSMIAYEKFGKGKTPESEGIKGDKFVGQFYQIFTKEAEKNPQLEEEAMKKLNLWESGDKETINLWKKMNSWAYKGMQETFNTFGLSKIDKNYYESEMYEFGKNIIQDGLKRKIFYKKEDGAIAIDLGKEGLGEKVVLRADGTSIYITQDLYLAEKRINDFKLDSSYYVVGNDQDYHFKVLFKILEKLGIKKDMKHLSYGMVALPSGKMKSRTGTTVYADDLIEDIKNLALRKITERGVKIQKKEIERRALITALAAIKYSLLKIDIKKQIIFDPKEAVSFEGDTGPYLLYSYARASSIIRKVKSKKPVKIVDLKEQEIKLLKKIDIFPKIVQNAQTNLAPNLIANYSFELSKLFNEFYHSCPVMGSMEEGFRLKLVNAFRVTLKKSLDLLGIEVLEEM